MACYHMNVISVSKNMGQRKDGQSSDFKNRIIFSNSPDFKGYEYYQKINDKNAAKGEPYNYKFIPCGKCIGCRAEERKNWAIRIELEARKYEHNYFLTLTYDNEHLEIPEKCTNKKTGEIYYNDGSWKGTLKKEHLTRFIKSFREYYRLQGYTGIKFYGCGEYGESKEGYNGNGGQRPHYHLILLNCPEIKLEPIGNYNKRTHDAYYTNKHLEHMWGKGFIQIGTVTWDSISYTAGYVSKKLFGEVKEEYYAARGQEPIFALMSRNPGIGKEFFNEKYKDIYETDKLISTKGKSIKTPRYFDKLMDKADHKFIKAVKEKREEISKYQNEIKMAQTSLSIAEQLKVEEEEAIRKQKEYNRERIK